MSWDASYQLLLPASANMAFWAPYKLYGEVDRVYSANPPRAAREWGRTQTVMNLVELVVGAIVLLRVFVFGRKDRLAFGLAIFVLGATMMKTITYFVLEHIGEWSNIGPAGQAPSDFVLLYILPNSVWILLPFLSMMTLIARLAQSQEEEGTKAKDDGALARSKRD